MFKSRGAISVFDFDDTIRNAIRGEPHRLVREEQAPPEINDLGPLTEPPDRLTALGPVVGVSVGGPEQPDVIVTGLCQGRARRADKQCWLTMGPSIEAVCILDFACRAAEAYGCPLEIWIPDQEYACSVVDPQLDSDSVTEIRVGDKLEPWCRSRYPNASIRRTSDLSVRSSLYSLVMDVRVADLYKTGVPRPYNSSGPVFWQELQFLATLAIFLLPAVREGKRVWAIADHEQLRPMAGAWKLAGSLIKIISLWPCPRLRWKPPSLRGDESTRYAQRFLTQLKLGNRRMFRGQNPSDMLFIDMTEKQISDRLSATADEEIYADTLLEILRYLGEAKDASQLGTLGEAVDALKAGLDRLQCFRGL